MADLEGRVRAVRSRIAEAAARAGRDPREITLIAVTKGFPAAVARDAFALGLRVFGENRVQEAREKVAALPGAEWHLIGSLQRNKAREAARLFAWIHSIDGLSLAAEVSRRAAALGRTLPVLVQVNVAGGPRQHGVAPGGVEGLVRAASDLRGIRIEGLMTIAPLVHDPEDARPAFRAVRQARDRIADLGIPGVSMRHLSMGMTDDFAVAVEEGATMVRIGRAIFGERP